MKVNWYAKQIGTTTFNTQHNARFFQSQLQHVSLGGTFHLVIQFYFT